MGNLAGTEDGIEELTAVLEMSGEGFNFQLDAFSVVYVFPAIDSAKAVAAGSTVSVLVNCLRIWVTSSRSLGMRA